jgi:hypothetical protein
MIPDGSSYAFLWVVSEAFILEVKPYGLAHDDVPFVCIQKINSSSYRVILCPTFLELQKK